jgi:hypothetical protein
MQWISCHKGRLLTQAQAQAKGLRQRSFCTGLEALDALAPEGAFACGAIHELLWEMGNGKPLFVATLLARSALGLPLDFGEFSRTAASRTKRLSTREAAARPSSPKSSGAIIWSDPHHELYPPALAHHGIPLEKLFLLRPKPIDQTWAICECLRCKGVGAVVAAVPRMTRVEARRLQLAAECGGGAGILLRPAAGGAQVYAAATRWLVRPAPGERTTQRWVIQLLHGHGGRVGQTVTLEYSRENHLVRALETVVDRPDQKTDKTRVLARAS